MLQWLSCKAKVPSRLCEFGRAVSICMLCASASVAVVQVACASRRARRPAALTAPARAQEIYNFAYLWSREKGQKCVQLDMATAMWRLLFTARPWPLCGAWCAFLEKHHGRAVSRDTWVQLLVFVQARLPSVRRAGCSLCPAPTPARLFATC
jgi:hypothetical protein